MKLLKNILLPLALIASPAMVIAQAASPAPQSSPPVVQANAPAALVAATPAAAVAGPVAAVSADGAKAKPAVSTDGSLPGYTPMKPTEGIGMPASKEVGFQKQFTENGSYANWIDGGMLWVIGAISLFVLGLLFVIILRFRASANPVPSKTTHNTMIEVLWTLGPVIILICMAVPSLDLLAKQFKSAPANAVTIKATGYQWYWGYTYPDHGGFEVVSNMLKEPGEAPKGERTRTDNDGPKLLAVDNRMVVPAGVPLRIQTTGSDVIHAFAVPSLWFKLDAVPGRLNEKSLTITKPGVYFGPCSELCGARHGFMPISIEALPLEKFALWVKAQGGKMPSKPGASKTVPASSAAVSPEATPAATPLTTTPAPAAAATK